jgi:hypothetical protein
LPSNRQLVTDAFTAWSEGTGYVAGIFAVNVRGIYADDENSTVVVLLDGAGTTVAGTTYDDSRRSRRRRHRVLGQHLLQPLWETVAPATGS